MGAFELWELPADFNLASRRAQLEALSRDCTIAPNRHVVACLGETLPREEGRDLEHFVIINDTKNYAKDHLGNLGYEIYPKEGDSEERKFEGGLEPIPIGLFQPVIEPFYRPIGIGTKSVHRRFGHLTSPTRRYDTLRRATQCANVVWPDLDTPSASVLERIHFPTMWCIGASALNVHIHVQPQH